MNDFHIPYEIIAKYFRKECSDDEVQLLELWKSMSELNALAFLELQNEWTYIHDDNNIVFPDKDSVWKKITNKTQPQKEFISNSKSFIWKVAAIAASIALIIGIGTTFIINNQLQTKQQEKELTVISVPAGQKTQMTLPDGTQVWLNSGSKLSYSGVFNKNDRRVILEGEAFFDVTENRKKQFIVETREIEVTVLGTAFDVMAYPEDNNISVSLLRGKVSLTSRDNKLLAELQPNEIAIISKTTMLCKLYKNDAETFHTWTQNQLVLYNADIYEVITKLERWYGVKIKIINPDKNHRYSFSVKTESLRELLDLFNKITPIKYKIEGEEVTISR